MQATSIGDPTKGNEAAQPTRIFVGIKVTSDIAEELAKLVQPLEGLPVRLIPAADLHLTLVPPWNEADISAAIEKLREAICGLRGFTLTFKRIAYGPTRRRPRLLWAECAPAEDALQIQALLLATFGQSQQRPFRPHVTLARMHKIGCTIASKHPFDQTLLLSQRVESIELFRSPRKGERGYVVLDSVPLIAPFL